MCSCMISTWWKKEERKMLEKKIVGDEKKIKEMLEKQDYPYEAESVLKMISKNYTYPYDIINAYLFGVLNKT